MTQLPRFSSPAGQAEKDFADDPAGLEAFNKTWNINLNAWTEIAIVGNPWSSQNDYNRYYYYNPLDTDIPENAQPAPILWDAFPGRLFNFFLDPSAPATYHLTNKQIFSLADTGYWPDQLAYLGDVLVPTNLNLCNCDSDHQNCNTNWQGERQKYTPQGPRGWLDEYCEWSVKRDANGELRQVMFTCENPAYWFNLWRHSPSLVTQLYQTHINPNVKEEDLYLRDSNGNPIHDPLLDYYAYDPTNKWNSGTMTESDQGGAMHLTSAPNTLSAEIYLAAAGTIPRTVGNQDPQALICSTWYGRPRRNSDPHIGQQANQVANLLKTGEPLPPGTAPESGSMLSLSDPVGLYIQMPNTQLWQVQKQKPDGSDYDPSTFWQVTRGYPDIDKPGQGYDSILHAVFTVPDELKPEDIVIIDPEYGQMPLQWAGQIVRTFNIALRVTPIDPTPAIKQNYPVPQTLKDPVPFSVPPTEDSLQPWPVQFLSSAAYNANSVDDSPAYVKQGTITEMALVVQGGDEHASIEFIPPDGIQPVTIKHFIGSGANTPGQTSGGSTQTYIFDLAIADTAALGERQIHVTNLDRQILPEQKIGEPGWLIITG